MSLATADLELTEDRVATEESAAHQVAHDLSAEEESLSTVRAIALAAAFSLPFWMLTGFVIYLLS